MRVTLLLLLSSSVGAFNVHPISSTRTSSLLVLDDAKIGIFFGTSTGSTEEAAEKIQEAFGGDVAVGPIDIDSIQGSVATEFAKYEALVVGTPTWNTGADTERSETGWDEVYYGEMQDLSIQGKKVAVFGLGDSVSYGENYADGSGELHDVFESLGCQMMGYVSQEGYLHEASKAIRGDKFCGLLLDAVNQEDMTDERVEKWVAQLLAEGILEGGSAPAAAPAAATPATSEENLADALARLERENAELKKLLSAGGGASSPAVPANEPVLAQPVNGDTFIPHTNLETGRTMWVSRDGRSCYYTKAPTQMRYTVAP